MIITVRNASREIYNLGEGWRIRASTTEEDDEEEVTDLVDMFPQLRGR